jgi:hypothetical protein
MPKPDCEGRPALLVSIEQPWPTMHCIGPAPGTHMWNPPTQSAAHLAIQWPLEQPLSVTFRMQHRKAPHSASLEQSSCVSQPQSAPAHS